MYSHPSLDSHYEYDTGMSQVYTLIYRYDTGIYRYVTCIYTYIQVYTGKSQVYALIYRYVTTIYGVCHGVCQSLLSL